ncbi:MAG: hypothetical protein AB7I30_03780 [Isosphaeraceae bacterium]
MFHSRPLIVAVLAIGWLPSSSRAQHTPQSPAEPPIGSIHVLPDDIYRYVQNQGITSVEGFLAHVNPMILKNYALMENSASRQSPSTVDRPRIILFRPDGKFFLGIATNPDSFAYESVEILALDRDLNGQAKGIDFDRRVQGAPVLYEGRDQDERCVGCHGPNLRPIWGRYNEWTGAFGEVTRLSPRQAEALTRNLAEDNPNPDPRLKALRFSKTSWAAGDSLVLPDRHGRDGNESLNEAIGGPLIERLYRRSLTVPNHEMYLTAHAFRVEGGLNLTGDLRRRLDERIDRDWRAGGFPSRFPQAEPRDRPLLLLGVDAPRDLDLPHVYRQADSPGQNRLFNKWQYISINIGDLFAFRHLNGVIKASPVLRSLMAATPHDNTGFCFVNTVDPFNDLYDYRYKTSSFLWEIRLEEKLARLPHETPPTVDLRFECMFPTQLQDQARPEFERLVAEVLDRHP